MGLVCPCGIRDRLQFSGFPHLYLPIDDIALKGGEPDEVVADHDSFPYHHILCVYNL